jgi:hypothetical protein
MGDEIFRDYAENAHIVKVIFFGTSIFCLLSFLCILMSGLTIWGIFETFKEGSFFGTSYIESEGPGKRAPTGEYSNLAILLMIISFAAFFSTIWLKLVINGGRGLAGRFKKYNA